MFASDYRRIARDTLRGKWKSVLCVMLLAQAVFLYFGLDGIYMRFFARPIQFNYEGFTYQLASYYGYMPVGLGWLLLAVLLLFECASGMVTVGEYRSMAALSREETPAVRQLFPWKLFGKALLMNIVRGLLVFAWSMLLVIPGIVAIYRYSMADYLLAENPELGPIEALRESRTRMMGRKGALFCLQMSFLGWYLLAMVPDMVLSNLLTVSGLPAVAANFIYTVAACLISAPLNAYMLSAQTAFFQSAGARAGAEQKQTIPTDFTEELRERFVPESESEPQQSSAAPDADESVAKDIYLRHACSRNRLRMEGMLEEYEALHPSSASEAGWRREYGDALMRRFDREPDALSELLGLCAEYADEQLANRALARIERHIRQQTLPDAEILDMAGRTLAVLTSGAFADEGFLARRREQISDMADRLEQRLREREAEGDWQRSLELIHALRGKN